MSDNLKLISKFYRLKNAQAIREFIEALPVEGLVETQMGINVYMGQGRIMVGGQSYPVGVRVWFHGDQLLAAVKSPGAHLDVEMEFDPFKVPQVVKDRLLKLAS